MIFLLFGMMVIVSVVKQTGLFEFLAIWVAQRSRGRPYRLMVLLVVLTAVASALLDNVTTVLLVAPMTFAVCARLGWPAAPYLIALVFASNIGGTATLIGDPPNIIIASRADLSFNDFLIHLAPVVAIILLAFLGLCRIMFRPHVRGGRTMVAGRWPTLRPADAITDRRLLVRCLIVLAGVVVGFVLHTTLHLEPSMVAMLGAGAMVLLSGLRSGVPGRGRVGHAGLLHGPVRAGRWPGPGGRDRRPRPGLGGRHRERYLLAATALLFGSAVLGAFVDNIPYTAAMAPIVEDLVAAAPDPQPAGRCGGRSRWAPTWAATPPRSPPEPTSW